MFHRHGATLLRIVAGRSPRFSKRPKWTASLGSGFDGSSFSDDENTTYDIEARKMRNIEDHVEPGTTLRPQDIDEFNKELEFIFGAAPSSERGTSPTHSESRGMKASPSSSSNREAVSLSHVDAAGKAAMVNVASKADTRRVATASGRVLLGQEAFELVNANSIAKGDVLTVAKVAGIMGAKQTGSLIPLCHPLLLSAVDVNLRLNYELFAVDIEAQVTTVGPTGVEMEALTAVSVASLVVYDMCKAVSKEIQITDVRLESKFGGKSGDWSRRRM